MPTRRFSTMSIRPHPYDPTTVPTAGISSCRGMRTPSTATGTPASKVITSSVGSVAVGTVMVKTSSGGWAHGSSMIPHSMARPHRFSSME